MKVLAVCGTGLGSGLVLKMQAEKALGKLGRDADVEIVDISSVRAQLEGADLVITSVELASQLGEVAIPVVSVSNFIDADEMTRKLSETLTGS